MSFQERARTPGSLVAETGFGKDALGSKDLERMRGRRGRDNGPTGGRAGAVLWRLVYEVSK